MIANRAQRAKHGPELGIVFATPGTAVIVAQFLLRLWRYDHAARILRTNPIGSPLCVDPLRTEPIGHKLTKRFLRWQHITPHTRSRPLARAAFPPRRRA